MKLTNEQKVFLAWLAKTDKIHHFELIHGKDSNGDSDSPMYGVALTAFRIFLSPTSYLHCVFTNNSEMMYVTEYHATTRRVPSMQVGLINRFFSKYRLTTTTAKGMFSYGKQIYISYTEFMSIVSKIDEKEFYSRHSSYKDSYNPACGIY